MDDSLTGCDNSQFIVSILYSTVQKRYKYSNVLHDLHCPPFILSSLELGFKFLACLENGMSGNRLYLFCFLS